MIEDHYIRKEKHKEQFEWTLPLSGCYKIFRGGYEIPWEPLHLLAFNYKLTSFRAFCVTFYPSEFSHPAISFPEGEEASVSFSQKNLRSDKVCYGLITCQISFLRNKLEYLFFQCKLRKLAVLVKKSAVDLEISFKVLYQNVV